MHEMSLMSEIVQLVSEDAEARGFARVDRIEVVIGDLSNVLADALELAFFHFRKEGRGLLAQESELKMIREPAAAKCQACMHEFEPDYRIALCPVCGYTDCFLLAGETFRVESYEGSDEDES
ncbi:hydrogenase maturation nickel metallochaperone HypA [Bacillus marinisedimentorum]|uniref:hydrogenase maturation nickel metallochaperone HypA/HybF n=1 Tax=Bacillus marinisedimentorum TaxID=1821260 RepID=UPI0007DEA9BB|nr:hydrogenase maturation nickel metallochaperone HypA [Bacillus marinisedimentorum]